LLSKYTGSFPWASASFASTSRYTSLVSIPFFNSFVTASDPLNSFFLSRLKNLSRPASTT